VKQYAPRPVTIRTLDIGGDKDVPYLAIPKEENPFLGWRAVRMYEEKWSLMRTQFRAILRASIFGTIKIMVPMIIAEEEVLTFKRLLEEAKESLIKEGIQFKPENIKVGIMVETPATALIAESLASHIDFFSLGTNDLTQYTLAVDRGNVKVANLFSSYHPAVLKLINMTAQAARKGNIEVSVCGEFASDLRGCLLIVGMGIENLSMTASLMLGVKDSLRKVTLSELKELSLKALTLPNSHSVVELTDAFRRTHGII
jgi:phosphotransferase system enzyme I (PtsI)